MLAYCYDKNGYFTEVKTVEKLEENQTNKPILTGYCKPRFINNSWVEGATPVSYTHLTLPTTPYV